MTAVRNTTIEWLRIFAAFLIVFIHTRFAHGWVVLDRLDTLGVPLFSMIAGYFWIVGLNRDVSLGRMVQRVRRIGIPFVIWSVVYWVANNVVCDGLLRGKAIAAPRIQELVSDLFLGGAAVHLWFLPCVIYLSGVTFLIWVAARTSRSRSVALGVIAVLSAAGVMVISDQSSESLLGWIKLYACRFSAFFALGGLMASLPKAVTESQKMMATALGLLLVGGVLLYALPSLYACTALVIGLMLFALQRSDLPMPSLVQRCAASTMDIYLVHPLITAVIGIVLERLGLTSEPVGLISAVFAFLLSWGVAALIQASLKIARGGMRK